MGVKAARRIRRWVLGAAMRLPGASGSTNIESLLSRFPDEALVPLRRNGLDPVPAGLDADHRDVRLIEEGMEQPHCV